jgi:hypothetical protein
VDKVSHYDLLQLRRLESLLLSPFGQEVDLEFDVAEENVLFLREPRLNLNYFVQGDI